MAVFKLVYDCETGDFVRLEDDEGRAIEPSGSVFEQEVQGELRKMNSSQTELLTFHHGASVCYVHCRCRIYRVC